MFVRADKSKVGVEEAVCGLRPVHESQVGPSVGQVCARWTKPRHGPIDDASQILAVPQQIARMEIPMHEHKRALGCRVLHGVSEPHPRVWRLGPRRCCDTGPVDPVAKGRQIRRWLACVQCREWLSQSERIEAVDPRCPGKKVINTVGDPARSPEGSAATGVGTKCLRTWPAA